MIPIEVYEKINEIALAASVLGGLMAWWRKGSDEEDRVVSDAADTIIDAVSSADDMRKIDASTGVNLREQITVQELEDMHRDRTLRRWPNRN